MNISTERWQDVVVFPVIPLLSSDGNLVSLSALRGPLSATPVPMDEGSAVGNPTVTRQEISVAIGAKLGVGSIFASSIQANETGFWMDAISYGDSPFRTRPNDIVSQTRWGYGMRLLCRAQQLDASLSLNFAVLGAAVELGLATASYEVQTFGLGPSALAAILNGISQFGSLNNTTLHELTTTVIQNLSKLIANPPAALVPRPLSVQLTIPIPLDPVVKARSEVYAMRRIRDGVSLKDALQRAGASLDAEAIRAVYHKVAPGVPETAPPDRDAVRSAKDWMG